MKRIHIVFIGVICSVGFAAHAASQTNAEPIDEPPLSESQTVIATTTSHPTETPEETSRNSQEIVEATSTNPSHPEETTTERPEAKTRTADPLSVPFYSQFTDVSDPSWKKLSCGVASLAMLIELYEPDEISSVDALLREGINSGAYIRGAGWSHRGLVRLAKKHGLSGDTYDFSRRGMSTAFAKLKASLKNGPAIVSVHYTFDPQNPIPHLAVINDIEGDTLYYNDPAETSGGGTLSAEKFKAAWKKRYITVRPGA